MKQPNIMLIICDQYRWDCLSGKGHPVVKTPHLDQLANEGVRFDNAYSSCPSCIAARASLFTGKYPTNTGFLGYEDGNDWNFPNMLPEVLRNSGYQTHCVGKTHFYPQRKHCGFEGLDSYEAFQNFDGQYVNDYFEWLRDKSDDNLHEMDLGLGPNSWIAKPSHLPEELHNNTWVVEKGMEFIKRRDRSRPYFLNLSFVRPHPPIDPPASYWEKYKDLPMDEVPIGDWTAKHDVTVTDPETWHGHLDDEDLRKCRMGYYAQIEHIDMQLGRMFQYLRERDEYPDLIIFTADHGEMLGDHHMFRKTYAYEGSAAIPYIVYARNNDAGLIRTEPVLLEDIYPTVLSHAGIPTPESVDGMDLTSLFYRAGRTDRQWVHGEHSTCYAQEEAMQFLTDGKTKYVWYTATGQEQLFDLIQDPYEETELTHHPDYQETLIEWRQRMIERLAQRPEDGLSDGKQLIPGILPAVRKPTI